MKLQRCIWHDSNAGAKTPTGEGMDLPLTAEYWAPNKLTKSGLMTCMCRWCKARRLKWKRRKDIADARAEARPVIIKQCEHQQEMPRFHATISNVPSIFKAVV